MELLTARDITFSYPGLLGRATPVLKRISLALNSGEVLGIFGPNGSGKTTLLRILAGLLLPAGGEVRHAEGQNGLAMVFQRSAQNLLPWNTAFQNVMLPATLMTNGQPDAGARSLAALDALGLTWAAGMYPSQLSGGEQQLVSLARWRAWPRSVLLIDEGLAMLDVTQRERALAWLRSYAQSMAGVILVSHNSADIAQACDRVLILSSRPAEVLREVSFGATTPPKEKAGALWAEPSNVFAG